ncbi:MAG: hypothetical protein K6U07_08565 [Firmicutes bacterium]|nr:hypothetical protein [Bacillota bacterium]
MNKEIISTSKAPAAIGPYSQAVKTGLVVFLSGQIGLDPATGELVGEDFEAQVRQAFKNLAAVAEAAGVAWAVRRYEEVRAFPSSRGVAFVGRGLPVHLWKTAAHQVARTAEQGTWLGLVLRGARLAARRLGVRPTAAYRAAVLRGAEVRRALVWFRDAGCLVCADRFRSGAEATWATVRLAAPPVPGEGRLRFDCRGLQGELRFLYGVSATPEVEQGFTSNGMAYVIRYALRHDTAAVAALVVGDVETSCEASPDGLVVRVGGDAAVVDLDGLEVRWC